MCSVSIIGVHGEGECVYIGDIDILKGLAAVDCIVGLGGAVSLCFCFCFLIRCRLRRRSCLICCRSLYWGVVGVAGLGSPAGRGSGSDSGSVGDEGGRWLMRARRCCIGKSCRCARNRGLILFTGGGIVVSLVVDADMRPVVVVAIDVVGVGEGGTQGSAHNEVGVSHAEVGVGEGGIQGSAHNEVGVGEGGTQGSAHSEVGVVLVVWSSLADIGARGGVEVAALASSTIASQSTSTLP